MAGEPLSETLRLERIEMNLFRGTTPPTWTGRIYGGQVIAQSLLAAYETVEDRLCHSLHAYFIRPGDPAVPIVFEVDRARDGGSFTTRRVVAVQHGQQIFNLAASFQAPEKGFEHQAPAPAHPHWSELQGEMERPEAAGVTPEQASRFGPFLPIEIRSADRGQDQAPAPPDNQIWLRSRDPVGPDQPMHQVVLAYASDLTLLPTALRPHQARWNTPGLQMASLDHAMWFHKPFNFEDWHLYVQDSPVAAAGRGFVRGAIYDEAGTLVASMAQEGLIRMREKR